MAEQGYGGLSDLEGGGVWSASVAFKETAPK